MQEKKIQPFTVFTSPDDKFKIWVQRPSHDGMIVCTCGFSLKSRMPFVDAIDNLSYLTVEVIKNVDEDMSHFILRIEANKYTARLIEDLPGLMDKYLH